MAAQLHVWHEYTMRLPQHLQGPSIHLPLPLVSQLRLPASRRRQRGLLVRQMATAAGEGGGDEQGPNSEWWSTLNRNSITGPKGPQSPSAPQKRGMGYDLMGEEGYPRYVESRKAERQRVWNVMRQTAAERLERGELPSWFNPHWLAQEEAPVNALLREMGDELYTGDRGEGPNPLAGGGGDEGSSNGGGGGWRGWNRGGGWWREDDPYWMMRDWGDHPMRWWTLGAAALLAFGGLLTYLSQGCVESLFWGWGTGAWLALCSLAMSDMTSQVQPHGELGVKAAWAGCALMALKDSLMGWDHKPNGSSYRSAQELLEEERPPMPWDVFIPKLPQLQMGACGIASAAMCVAYMITGMSGLEWHALPDNPGAVYKSHDIVYKHYVWSKWGYGQNSMRV